MANKNLFYSGTALVAFAVLLAAWPAPRPAAQPAPQGAIQIDSDDIGGVVTSKNGPEAGVWVIRRRPSSAPGSPRWRSPTIADGT